MKEGCNYIIEQYMDVKMLMKNKPNNKLYSSETIKNALLKEKNNEQRRNNKIKIRNLSKCL